MWPTKRWIGVLCLVSAGLVLVIWGVKAYRESHSEQVQHDALPGITLNLLVRIENRLGGDRQYLLDFGQVENSRLSLYISPDKFLTFVLIDAKGEPHALQIPVGGKDIPLDRFIYLACEIGVKGQSSVMRILVNGRQVRYEEMPFQVDIGALDAPGGVVGSDLQGEHGARFDLVELSMNSATYTDGDIANMLCYFQRGTPKTAYGKYSGQQWMRVKDVGRHDLIQADPTSRPTYQTLTEEDKRHWLETPCPLG